MDLFTIAILVIAVFLLPVVLKSIGGLFFNFIKLAVIVGGGAFIYFNYTI